MVVYANLTSTGSAQELGERTARPGSAFIRVPVNAFLASIPLRAGVEPSSDNLCETRDRHLGVETATALSAPRVNREGFPERLQEIGYDEDRAKRSVSDVEEFQGFLQHLKPSRVPRRCVGPTSRCVLTTSPVGRLGADVLSSRWLFARASRSVWTYLPPTRPR